MPEPLATAVGIDLAWSSKNFTGLAAAHVFEDEVRIVETICKKTLDDIVAFENRHHFGPLTIAIDAPTIVPNTEGMRECERILQADFWRYGAGPYPANRELLGKVNAGRPRGEELVEILSKSLGAQQVGVPPARHRGIYVMEVFPAPAMVRLFGLSRALRYKKKKKRSWEFCRAGLTEYLVRLGGLRKPLLTMPKHLKVETEIGVALKGIEDQTDAVMCCYLAGLGWLGGSERLEMVGSIESGYVVFPKVCPPLIG